MRDLYIHQNKLLKFRQKIIYFIFITNRNIRELQKPNCEQQQKITLNCINNRCRCIIHDWQRVPNPPILWRPLYICNIPSPTFFKFYWSPLASNLHPHCSFCCLVFFDWVGGCATTDVLFYLMIVWIYTCQALVPWCQKVFDMCFMQQVVTFTETWHI